MKAKFYSAMTMMTACLPAIVYIIWVNAYYWLLEGGRYKAFMQPKLWPLLVLALVLLLMFVAVFISGFTRIQDYPARFDPWLRSAILFLPVLFLWSIYGQSLGGHAFVKRALNPADMSSVAGVSPFPSSPGSTMTDRVTLLNLVKDTEIFDGKQVTVEGMVYRAPDHDDKTFMLFRFAIVCCAADAFPVGILVRHTGSEGFGNDAWVNVAGQLRIETINAKQRPIIEADTVRQIPIPTPENRYLFF